ncbi:MAG: Asp-tRNA(Asn)/Glu-tRNA(Gln) amidotransferase subunit GatB, partial [Clostridia bacterium]|nr:Asp-tRNA(Asn)/Glu-tRNA(Gln) amidotransferase subunit GatB [Clostridia bacterium]
NQPNTNTCPVCTSMPGALPVLNRDAVERAILMGLAVGCRINNYSVFERKNYFYPDLAKAYQISQLEYPLCVGGGLEIEVDGKKKFIRLNRIHLEEDAGKLIHDNQGTLVDYNRGGVPLIEIVSEPDMNSAEEAVAYLEKLRSTLLYVGVSDCKMQEGSIRFDVNISVNKPGEPFGTRTELKNLNSFRAVLRAIKYEANRQIEVLESGGQIVQETRRWDDEKGKTFSMRSKEDSQDYRYFPDPDLIPLDVTPEYIESIRKRLPKLAPARVTEYVAMGLTEQDANLLTAERKYADFFEAVLQDFNEPKFVCNWITAEVFKKLNALDEDDKIIPVQPKQLAEMLKMYKAEEINQAGARKIFDILWEKGGEPRELVEALGLKQMNDTGALKEVIQTIMQANPKAVQELKDGNQKTMAFFVGQAMKATQGKANPKMVADIVNELIN